MVGADVDVSLGADVKVGGATLGDAADVGATVFVGDAVGSATFVAAAIVWVGIGVPSIAVEASQAITANIIITNGKKFFILVILFPCLHAATSHNADLFHCSIQTLRRLFES